MQANPSSMVDVIEREAPWHPSKRPQQRVIHSACTTRRSLEGGAVCLRRRAAEELLRRALHRRRRTRQGRGPGRRFRLQGSKALFERGQENRVPGCGSWTARRCAKEPHVDVYGPSTLLPPPSSTTRLWRAHRGESLPGPALAGHRGDSLARERRVRAPGAAAATPVSSTATSGSSAPGSKSDRLAVRSGADVEPRIGAFPVVRSTTASGPRPGTSYEDSCTRRPIPDTRFSASISQRRCTARCSSARTPFSASRGGLLRAGGSVGRT